MHLVLALISNISSYYNYSILTLAASFIAQEFLPPSSKAYGLSFFFALISFSVIARPLASMFFGMVGDLRGRAVAIKITGFTGALAMLMLCFCPGFSDVGYLAVISVVISRVLVLANIAAEPDGMRIYVSEHLSSKHLNLGNGLVSMTGQLGVLLASMSIFLSYKYDISMRFAFGFAAILNLFTIFTRNSLLETKEFKINEVQVGLRDFLRQNFSICIICFLINGAIGGLYNFYIIFVKNYTQELFGPAGLNITIASIASYAFFAPVAGYLADQIKPAVQIVLSLLIMMFFCIAGIYYLNISTALPVKLFMLQIACMAFFTVPLQIYLKPYIPLNLRYRVLSTCHSAASLLISTPSLLLANFLWAKGAIFCFSYGLFLMFVLLACTLALSGFRRVERL